MENEKRTKTAQKVDSRLNFAKSLLNNLMYDVQKSVEKQNKDPWDKSDTIRNRTRYAGDVRLIRRELLKAVKIFEDKE